MASRCEIGTPMQRQVGLHALVRAFSIIKTSIFAKVRFQLYYSPKQGAVAHPGAAGQLQLEAAVVESVEVHLPVLAILTGRVSCKHSNTITQPTVAV